jgi:hypothetical protein
MFRGSKAARPVPYELVQLRVGTSVYESGFYQEPSKVTVEEMPNPTIQEPNDAIVRITTTNICGSALRTYEGRTPGTRNVSRRHCTGRL